jgi:hypothetical protein
MDQNSPHECDNLFQKGLKVESCKKYFLKTVDTAEPIFTGEEKLPFNSESCAVKIFPALNDPVAV